MKQKINTPAERLLTIDEVMSQISFKRSFIYESMQDNKFPKPVRIGRSIRWKQSDIQKWISDQTKFDTEGAP